jgi:hypothetical protein
MLRSTTFELRFYGTPRVTNQILKKSSPLSIVAASFISLYVFVVVRHAVDVPTIVTVGEEQRIRHWGGTSVSGDRPE